MTDLMPIIIIVFAIIISAMILLGARSIKKELSGIRTDLQEIDVIIKSEEIDAIIKGE